MSNYLKKLNLEWYKIIILSLITLLMFGGMIMFSDMKITTVGSLSILRGHFFDFYDFSINSGISPDLVYYPSMYWIFAIWNIPICLLIGSNIETYTYKQMVVLLYWGKLLVLLFCVLSLYFFYKICRLIFDNEKTAFFATTLFLFTPYLFISQLTFGTYDYIYMFFVLWGLYIYLKKEKHWWWKFSIIFGFSFTIKQLTLFIYLPLLLYREKKLFNIFKNITIAVILYIIETIMYYPQTYFRDEVLNSHFILFMTKMVVNNGIGTIALWGILFGGLLCFCYYCEYDEVNYLKPIWLCMLGPIFILLTCHWTINWILLYIPMLIILLVASPKRQSFYLIELGFCVLFILMLFYQQTNYWGYEYYGEGMLDYSIFCKLRDSSDSLLTTKIVSPDIYPIIMGALYSVMIFYIIFLSPFSNKSKTCNFEITKQDSNYLFSNFVIGSLLYIIPIFIGVL